MSADHIRVADVVEDIIFQPTADQRKVKAALWAVVADNPIHSPDSITAEDIIKVTGDTRVRRWMKESPLFREWLLNKDEFRQRLEYHAHLALDRLEKILSDDNAHASAQVQAAKLIIEAANKNGRITVVDDEIGNPTYAPDLARAIAQLIETQHYGIYHFINEGIASRYDFAVRILQMAGVNAPIQRGKLADYKRDSTPPAYGALQNYAAATMLGIKLRSWEDALEDYFKATK